MAGPEGLERVSLFEGLSKEELRVLTNSLRRRHYDRSEVIFNQDDPGVGLYIIDSGRVKIALSSDEGKEVILSILGPEDFFGELALLDGEPRSADAVAQEECQLLFLPREEFLTFLERHPRAAIGLLATLSRRLRRTDQLLHDAAFLDVPARLAMVILRMAQEDGQTTPEGILIPFRITQTDLAALVGTTRESINKGLAVYTKLGLVRYREGRVLVLRPDGLRQYAS